MPVEEVFRIEAFDQKKMPTYPCPRCQIGRVVSEDGTLRIEEPKYSSNEHGHDAWEPEWIVERFSVTMKCAEAGCGEIVTMAGRTEIAEEHDEEHGNSYVQYLHPKFMYPAPILIKIPKGISQNVSDAIKKACELFWSDFGSSAGKLRISLEYLLDFLLIPKAGVDKNGNAINLDLNNRIQLYEKSNPGHADSFHALRIVGNIGSHGDGLTREVLLDALEIYEDALEEIIGNRKAKIAAMKKKIIDNKGIY